MATTARRWRPSKFQGYFIGMVTMVGGGFVSRYIDPTAGAAIVAAGAWWVGKLQRESLPAPSKGLAQVVTKSNETD